MDSAQRTVQAQRGDAGLHQTVSYHEEHGAVSDQWHEIPSEECTGASYSKIFLKSVSTMKTLAFVLRFLVSFVILKIGQNV